MSDVIVELVPDPVIEVSVADCSVNRSLASESAAAISAQAAAVSATQTGNYISEMHDAVDDAEAWATAPEDEEVAPGQYSSFHWAQKAILGGSAALNDWVWAGVNEFTQRVKLTLGALLPNSVALKGRNVADDASVNLIQLNASDQVTVGGASDDTLILGNLVSVDTYQLLMAGAELVFAEGGESPAVGHIRITGDLNDPRSLNVDVTTIDNEDGAVTIFKETDTLGAKDFVVYKGDGTDSKLLELHATDGTGPGHMKGYEGLELHYDRSLDLYDTLGGLASQLSNTHCNIGSDLVVQESTLTFKGSGNAVIDASITLKSGTATPLEGEVWYEAAKHVFSGDMEIGGMAIDALLGFTGDQIVNGRSLLTDQIRIIAYGKVASNNSVSYSHGISSVSNITPGYRQVKISPANVNENKRLAVVFNTPVHVNADASVDMNNTVDENEIVVRTYDNGSSPGNENSYFQIIVFFIEGD